LDALQRTGWRGPVFIVDDNFIGNKRNVKKLLPELARREVRPLLFVAISVRISGDKASRAYAVARFGEIRHPKLKLFWVTFLFNLKEVSRPR